ncbi:hypothetical protein ERJ75_001845300 [Trypanosoma vivax]|nr:hypothetical protein ERJ75_001845300 [Trypanosoma vivax]
MKGFSSQLNMVQATEDALRADIRGSRPSITSFDCEVGVLLGDWGASEDFEFMKGGTCMTNVLKNTLTIVQKITEQREVKIGVTLDAVLHIRDVISEDIK